MVTQVTIHELATATEQGGSLIDVRERHEYVSGHVPGAEHIPMHTVPLRLDDLRDRQPVYLICESGNRSWQVASFLARHDIQAVNVAGGTFAWRMSGMPLETGATA
jgi:rhodanese-related sulfurtransferase